MHCAARHINGAHDFFSELVLYLALAEIEIGSLKVIRSPFLPFVSTPGHFFLEYLRRVNKRKELWKGLLSTRAVKSSRGGGFEVLMTASI